MSSSSLTEKHIHLPNALMQICIFACTVKKYMNNKSWQLIYITKFLHGKFYITVTQQNKCF